ncbi:hypothetical protein Rhal01_03430 [Rubritalea halochordaticola]|uniref:Lipoprotein n=2 Tax=Rubritalea halochordaticola TaxID=714537 RepID=A0ABP9V792_9BACT
MRIMMMAVAWMGLSSCTPNGLSIGFDFSLPIPQTGGEAKIGGTYTPVEAASRR